MAMIPAMLPVMVAPVAISTAWVSKEGNRHKRGDEGAEEQHNGQEPDKDRHVCAVL